jgi:hypothetical protein
MYETALKNNNHISTVQMNTVCQYTPQTLQAFLLQEFTRVCFQKGKGYEEDLKIINEIYLNYV